MALEDRIGIVPVVAVAVVERKANELAPENSFAQAAMHLVERNEVDAGAAQAQHQPLEEVGRHLEQTVGLERRWSGRAHVMQREDGADAAEQRPQRQMRPREVERLETGSDQRPVRGLHVQAPHRDHGRSDTDSGEYYSLVPNLR